MPSTKTSPADVSASSRTAGPVVGAIPARYASSRFPGKPLAPIAGKPMIEHVYRRAVEAGLDPVVVLTDDERIASAVSAFGGSVKMTPADCATGTDRIAWAAQEWDCAAVVNIQGDEPLIDPRAITRVAERLLQSNDPIVTLASEGTRADADDPNVVKVVCDVEGNALYFSRAPVPYERNPPAPTLRHIGIYGYRRTTLIQLAALPETDLERVEGLEQLRALANGIRIRVLLHDSARPGVDTPEDLQRVENYLDANPDAPESRQPASEEE